MTRSGVRHLVFSSTCAVYGEPARVPLVETDTLEPTNPYGETKLAFERALRTYHQAYGLKFVSLRYFNAAGATAKHQERHNPETHLIPIVLEAAAGVRPHVTIFGTDYQTPDGTCVRDYIHVSDLARAHALALDGIGRGMRTCTTLVAVGLDIQYARSLMRRESSGDSSGRGPPAGWRSSCSSSCKAQRELGWTPEHHDLLGIIESAWRYGRGFLESRGTFASLIDRNRLLHSALMEPELIDSSSATPVRSTIPVTLTPDRKDMALDAALQRVTSGVLSVFERPPANEPAGSEERITAVRRLPACPARSAPFPPAIDPRLRAALGARGIAELYTHQAEAIEHALHGRHVVVTTPTASGKTLCYNVPILNAVLHDPSSRALYLFPTKALAQDQLAELHALSSAIGESSGFEIGVHTYDGDTPQDARRAIRGRAHARAQQPRYVAFGDPAAPSQVGEAVRESAVHRDRRTACLPRRLREPSGERPAATAPYLPALWVSSGLHLLVSDHRQPP